jgi:AcrR family transcriptional regulator
VVNPVKRPRKAARGAVPAPKRWLRDRAGKEQALINAFDELLQEEGAHRVSVNSVIKRAGVGKSLLYDYFGDLGGLATAWAARTDFLPGDAEMLGDDPAAYARLSTQQQLTRNYQRYLGALRKRPRTLAVLASELVADTDATRALDRVRTTYGKGLARYFSRPEEYERREVVALQVLLYGAVTYLALRSRTSPRYFGLRLDRDAGWREVDDMLELVIGRVMGGSGLRKPREARARTKRAPRRKSI